MPAQELPRTSPVTIRSTKFYPSNLLAMTTRWIWLVPS